MIARHRQSDAHDFELTARWRCMRERKSGWQKQDSQPSHPTGWAALGCAGLPTPSTPPSAGPASQGLPCPSCQLCLLACWIVTQNLPIQFKPPDAARRLTFSGSSHYSSRPNLRVTYPPA